MTKMNVSVNVNELTEQDLSANSLAMDVFNALNMTAEFVEGMTAEKLAVFKFFNVPNDKTLQSFDMHNVVQHVGNKKLFGIVRLSYDLIDSKKANKRKLVEAILHNLLHMAQNASGVPAKKSRQHNLEYKRLAEKYGMIAKKYADDTANNYLYGDTILTDKTWKKLKPIADKYSFNFTSAVKQKEQKPKEPKAKFYYVHPDRIRYVVTDTKQEMFALIDGEYVAYTLADEALMKEVRHNIAERKRTHPNPEARQETFA